MRIEELEWDDENMEHIARPNVRLEEVEDVCFGLHISEKAGKERYVLSEQTVGGRHLNVVVERVGKGLFRPITAFEMSDSYRRNYKKRMRQN